MKVKFILVFVASLILSLSVSLGQINFNTKTLQGMTGLNTPTCIQFGPDGKFYLAQQDGRIKIYSIAKSAGNYSATLLETVDLVRQIPNHWDDGTLKPYNANTNKRQITGMHVVGSPSNIIIYVTSTDSDIGGEGNGDKDLCTNSGIISRLTKIGNTWNKIDLVRGLPRSEENHAVNGLVYDEIKNLLYVTCASNTNAGAPSKLFAYTGEYAYTTAILSVDLAVLDAMSTKTDPTGKNPFKYDLPTLDDPTRPNNPDGTDINDPFGGNDGLNMAKLVVNGPVQIYACGFRNPYDILLSKTPGKARRLYTSCNGPNPGWGGYPLNEGTPNANNNYDPTEPGSTSAYGIEPVVDNRDKFYCIGNVDTYVPGTFYGGHPNPIRGNPTGCGLYTFSGTNDAGSGVFRTSKTDPKFPLPQDWPPVPPSMANPIEVDNQAAIDPKSKCLLSFTSSTNGLCEYTASNFGGAMKGDILACNFDGYLTRIRLSADGSQVLNSKGPDKLTQDPMFATGFGPKPLDITAMGDNEAFPGTIWVAMYGNNSILVFEPQGGITCTGANNNSDEDGDHFTNADEIANGTNPCSGSSFPPDNDGDFISDLNDPDDDNDGKSDLIDLFQTDAANGKNTNIPLIYNLFNNDPGYGFFGMGFTGLMNDGTDYLTEYRDTNLVAGGATGSLTIANVTPGDALGNLNNQEYAFQFGINVNSNTTPFFVHSKILGVFFNGKAPINNMSQGIYIGNGDQDNYIKIVLNSNNGAGGIQTVFETGGNPVTKQYNIPYLPTNAVDLYIYINPKSGKVWFKYILDGADMVSINDTINTTGTLLNTIKGSTTSALAVGVISTSRSANKYFNATWDMVEVQYDNNASKGNWTTLTTSDGSSMVSRQENAYVQAGDKFYLLGGRGSRPVSIYDPLDKSWKKGAIGPLVMHHFQAVEYKGLIYAVGAFTGDYPDETPLPNIYIYDPVSNQWYTGPVIPAERRRASAGVVVYNNKIYIAGGIINGHQGGFVQWFDEFDPATNTWRVLPDAPRKRDHFQAALVDGKIYLAGGRQTSLATGHTIDLTIGEVDVYDFSSNQWTTLANKIPTQRGGASTAVLNKEVIIIGGESNDQFNAHSEAEALNTETGKWRSLDTLNKGRQATQAISNNGNIFIASGNGTRGGGAELTSQELFSFDNEHTPILNVINKSQLSGPSEVNFGVVSSGNSKSLDLLIENIAGNQAIIINSVNIAVNPDSVFSRTLGVTLPVVILPGGSLTIPITFTPSSASSYVGSIQISHSGIGGSLTVPIKGGQGVPPVNPGKKGLFWVNAGGDPLTDGNILWASDLQSNPSAYVNSAVYNKTTTGNFNVTNNTDAPSQVFNSYRWDGGVAGDALSKEMNWRFWVVDSGSYEVNLYFAETSNSIQAPGQRVFGILIEGQTVLNNYDIIADVGFKKAVKKTFTVNVKDGYMDIVLTHIVQNPIINGISIYRIPPPIAHLATSLVELDFDAVNINTTVSKNLVLANTGNNALTINSLEIGGQDASSFFHNVTLPLTIPIGQNSTIQMNFKPLTVGDKSANLTIGHNGDNTPYSLPLSGTGKSTGGGTPASRTALFYVNAGGQQLAQDTVTWLADMDTSPSPYVNSTVYNKTTVGSFNVTNSTDAPASLFNDYRWDGGVAGDALSKEMTWKFPLADTGTYEVNLYFAETAVAMQGNGLRVFNVNIEGQTVLNNYDIFADAGFKKAVKKTFTVKVTNKILDIVLVHVVQNPKIEGISIFKITPAKNASLKVANSGTNNPKVIYRVNAGGTNIASQDTTGVSWDNDTPQSPSYYVKTTAENNKVNATNDTISLDSTVPANTPASLFQSDRELGDSTDSALKWEFPVAPGGEVEVRLYFSEVMFNTPGERVFDIQVEDTIKVSNYDIVKEAGKDKGTMKTFKTTSDGSVNINLIRVKQLPKVNGIEIICLNDKCNSTNLKFGAITNDNSGNAFPNPFHNQIKVKLSEKGETNMKINIFNSKGILLEASEVPFTNYSEFLEFDLSHLPQGIYFLKIESEGKEFNETFRLVKE